MKQLSLKMRLFLLVALPSMALILAVSGVLWHLLVTKQRAERILDAASLFKTTSGLIHSLQLERGKSNLYVNGKITEELLRTAREETNRQYEKWRNEADQHGAQSELSSLDSIDQARLKVGTKNPVSVSDAIRTYSESIAALLQVEKNLAAAERLEGLEALMATSVTFEFGKENAGRFRAQLAKITARDQALSPGEVGDFEQLFSRFSVIFDLPHLEMNKDERDLMSRIVSTSQWRRLSESHQLIIEKAKIGGFGLDSGGNFAAASTVIDQVTELNQVLLARLENQSKEVGQRALYNLVLTTLVTLLGLFALSVISYQVTQRLIGEMKQVATNLKKYSSEVKSSAQGVHSSSQSLAEATTEQASALEETAASLQEITAMIGKASENANAAAASAGVSQGQVAEGQKAIHNLLAAISEMNEANHHIGDQVHETNENLGQIVQLIHTINDKTKIINEIVFQTKLLSFNASVEAARAGEQGRGFAVVASEVGSLAAMSGKASLEIGEMLASSLSRVEQIAQESRDKIEILLERGTDKIHAGQVAAEQSARVFSQVHERVVQVAQLAKEIATANSEQAIGVSEINKAVAQLDIVTQQNATESEKTAQSSERLSLESVHLESAAIQLVNLIEGQKAPDQVAERPMSSVQSASVVSQRIGKSAA